MEMLDAGQPTAPSNDGGSTSQPLESAEHSGGQSGSAIDTARSAKRSRLALPESSIGELGDVL